MHGIEVGTVFMQLDGEDLVLAYVVGMSPVGVGAIDMQPMGMTVRAMTEELAKGKANGLVHVKEKVEDMTMHTLFPASWVRGLILDAFEDAAGLMLKSMANGGYHGLN